MERYTTDTMEALLSQLLTITLELEESIYQDDPEPEEWVRIIGQRQGVMDQISLLQENGVVMTDDEKQRFVRKVHELDNQLIPAMELKKAEVQRRIHNLNKSKAVNQQYMGGNSYNPYGSFFDKKK